VTKYGLDVAGLKVVQSDSDIMVFTINSNLAGKDDQADYSKESDKDAIKEYVAKFECKKGYGQKYVRTRMLTYYNMLMDIMSTCPTMKKCGEAQMYEAYDAQLKALSEKKDNRLANCVLTQKLKEDADKKKELNKKKFEIFLSIIKAVTAAVPLGGMIGNIADAIKTGFELAQDAADILEAGKNIYDNVGELTDKEKLELTADDVANFISKNNAVVKLSEWQATMCTNIALSKPNTPERAKVCGSIDQSKLLPAFSSSSSSTSGAFLQISNNYNLRRLKKEVNYDWLLESD
jgi:hypothetical protein